MKDRSKCWLCLESHSAFGFCFDVAYFEQSRPGGAPLQNSRLHFGGHLGLQTLRGKHGAVTHKIFSSSQTVPGGQPPLSRLQSARQNPFPLKTSQRNPTAQSIRAQGSSQTRSRGQGERTQSTFWVRQTVPGGQPPFLMLQSGWQNASPFGSTSQRKPVGHFFFEQGLMQILSSGQGDRTHTTFFVLQMWPLGQPPLLRVQSGWQKDSLFSTSQRKPLGQSLVEQGSKQILWRGQGDFLHTTFRVEQTSLSEQPPLLRLQSGWQNPTPFSTSQRKPFWQRIVAQGLTQILSRGQGDRTHTTFRVLQT